MKIRYEKGKLINTLLYITYVLIYFITLKIYGMGDSNSRIRYYFLAFIVVVGIITLFVNRKREKKRIYNKELLLSLVVAIVFFIISVQKAKIVNMPLSFRTIVQLSLIFLPSIYAFFIVNNFSLKTIISLMKITLFITIIIYFTEPKHTILSLLSLSNWSNIDVFNSKSFTESSLCSETFLQLFLFFFYFKNMDIGLKERENIKKYSIVSFIFVILAFKRFAMFFSIIIIVFNKYLFSEKKISKYHATFLALVFTILTFYYKQFISGEIIFKNIDVYKFSTGRDYILSLWASKEYFSYGYGTSMLVIGRYLEMDFVQIYLELNLMCVFIYCYYLFNLSRHRIYSIGVIIYECFNMLFASSLPTTLPWLILLITNSCINSKKIEDENIKILSFKAKGDDTIEKN